jgi:hypothetical protein
MHTVTCADQERIRAVVRHGDPRKAAGERLFGDMRVMKDAVPKNRVVGQANVPSIGVVIPARVRMRDGNIGPPSGTGWRESDVKHSRLAGHRSPACQQGRNCQGVFQQGREVRQAKRNFCSAQSQPLNRKSPISLVTLIR